MARGIQLISVLYKRGQTTENVLPVQKGGERRNSRPAGRAVNSGSVWERACGVLCIRFILWTSTNLESLSDKIFLKENQLIPRRNKSTYLLGIRKKDVCAPFGVHSSCVYVGVFRLL